MKTPLHEIATLAGSLETELKTAEIHKSNDFYGFASVLKKYAGVPDTYQIKAAIEHGPLMGNCIWDNDIEAPLPAIFPMSRCRRMFLNKKTDKPVIPIGPVITYAEGYLSMEELRNEKQKLGRTLVAFPAHSTHWIDVAYDIEGYCNFLEELGKSFDTVIVCLYWKDVLRRVAEHYRARGFYCVTAGHIFDPLFMSRLRSIIALADLTTSNEISSVLGYCVLLGKPHYYHEVHTTWHAPSQDILIRDTCGGTGARPFFRWIFDLFKEPMDVVTDRQRDVISYYWGLYDSKTPREMAVLFQLTEEMYRRKLSHRRDFSMLSLQKTGSDLSKYSKAVFQKSDTADACEGINGKASFQGQQGFFEKEQTQSLHHTSSHYDATQQQFSVKVAGFYSHNPPIIQKRASGRTFGLQKLLNLGCGNRYHPDWVNVDMRSNGNGVIGHDLKKPLPFDDASFVAVYHSHLLEHFPKEYAPVFLRECFRVLKPGGIIRVAVPDLEQIARLYLQCLDRALQGDEAAQKRYEWIVLELFDQMVRTRPGGAMFEYWQRQPMPAEDFVLERMGSQVRTFLKGMRQQKENSSGKGHGLHQAAELTADEIGRFRLSGEVHQWMYDRYSLGKLLRDSGFEDVRVCRADESAIPDFNTYLLDIEADGSVRKPDSLFMEGRKPAAVTTRKEHNTCVGIENRGENVLSFL